MRSGGRSSPRTSLGHPHVARRPRRRPTRVRERNERAAPRDTHRKPATPSRDRPRPRPRKRPSDRPSSSAARPQHASNRDSSAARADAREAVRNKSERTERHDCCPSDNFRRRRRGERRAIRARAPHPDARQTAANRVRIAATKHASLPRADAALAHRRAVPRHDVHLRRRARNPNQRRRHRAGLPRRRRGGLRPARDKRAAGPAAERRSCRLVLHFATYVKRTAPAFRRCKNEQERCSRGRDRARVRRVSYETAGRAARRSSQTSSRTRSSATRPRGARSTRPRERAASGAREARSDSTTARALAARTRLRRLAATPRPPHG